MNNSTRKKDIDVFISYSSTNESITIKLAEILEESGLRCWYSGRECPKADTATWEEAIDNALHHSRAFVILFDKHASESVHVPRELTLAVKNCEVILPFMLDYTEPEGRFSYNFSGCEYIEAQTNREEKMHLACERPPFGDVTIQF